MFFRPLDMGRDYAHNAVTKFVVKFDSWFFKVINREHETWLQTKASCRLELIVTDTWPNTPTVSHKWGSFVIK